MWGSDQGEGFRIPIERVREILANPPLSKYGKPFNFQKHQDQVLRVYKQEMYQQMLCHRGVFIVQINGMSIMEYKQMQKQCLKKGMQATRIRNAVFNHVIMSKAQTERDMGFLEPMKDMVAGPCCAVFTNVSDEENPNLVKDVMGILGLKGIRDKALLVGGRLDQMLLTTDSLKQVALMPTLKQLQTQLVGVLASPARETVNVIESNPKTLVKMLSFLQK